jgi:DNA-binding response OmpR family regulator
MKDIRICIFDTDAIRAEAIKEVLSNEGYSITLFSSEVSSLKALLEESYDAIFVGLDFVDDIIGYLVKVRNYAPASRIVAILGGQFTDYQFTLAELGITRYIETPVTSTSEILDAIQGIESEIMDEDEKTSFMVSILEYAKKAAVSDKKMSKKVRIALEMFVENTSEQNKLKGEIKDIPYFEVVRLVCALYKEGVLEFVNEQERALFVVKNNSIVSAYVTPGVRGLKAFLRVAGWGQGNFNFKNKIYVSYGLENDLSGVEISRLYHLAKRTHDWFARMKNNLPPKQLEVKVDTRIAGKKIDLSALEFDVLTTVVDHNSIYEIMNYNSNVDADVLDALINLRRKGAIEVKV